MLTGLDIFWVARLFVGLILVSTGGGSRTGRRLTPRGPVLGKITGRVDVEDVLIIFKEFVLESKSVETPVFHVKP